MEEYNFKGQLATGEDKIFAKKAENELGCKYWVLYNSNKLADPKEVGNRLNERLKFVSCTEKRFNGYLSFLRGGEMRKYRELSRIQ